MHLLPYLRLLTGYVQSSHSNRSRSVTSRGMYSSIASAYIRLSIGIPSGLVRRRYSESEYIAEMYRIDECTRSSRRSADRAEITLRKLSILNIQRSR